MKRCSTLLIALLLAAGALADDWDVHRPGQAGYNFSGLSVFVDAGLVRADNRHAAFYDGREGNPNTIYRLMHSQAYGEHMWSDLVSQGLISPSAIQSYSQLQIEEYPHMYYRLAYQLGFGFRYDYNGGWGWLIRFDYAQLRAVGAFLLSSNNGTGVLSNMDQYVRCGISGQEKRMLIDIAATKRFNLTPDIELETDLGLNLNNTQVQHHDIEVAGTSYDILDRWAGQSPGIGSQPYEYINQGGLGFGALATISACYKITAASISVGYTCYYTNIKLEQYEGYAPQHTFFLRFDLNSFSFFD